MSIARPPIPTTLLAGFLGAGKTTLVNELLRAADRKVAVVVNDFGAIDIDTALTLGVERSEDELGLANGCICCSIRTDLLDVLARIVERPDPPDHIVIECSGVSDPVPIAHTLLTPLVRQRMRLELVAVAADAEQLLELHGSAKTLARQQLRAADLVVMTKADRLPPSTLALGTAWVRESVPTARCVESAPGRAPIALLLGGLPGPAPAALAVSPTDEAIAHDRMFASWSYTSIRPISLQALRDAMARLPPSIYRVKGLLHVIGDTEHAVVLQVVGRRVEFSPGPPWTDELPPRTRLVALGRPDELDPSALRTMLTKCDVGSVPPDEIVIDQLLGYFTRVMNDRFVT